MRTLLEMSLSGAVLAVFVLAFRRAAGRKVPAKALVLLWDILTARLLIPLSLPSVPGLGSAAQFAFTKRTAAQGAGTGTDIWLSVWEWGLLVAAAATAYGYAREAHMLRRARPLTDLELQRCRRLLPKGVCTELRVSDSVGSAVAFGLVRNRIILPSLYKSWSDDTLRCVLTHEWVHITRADNLRRLLSTAAACVHWFNPLAWAAAFCLCRDTESACDQKAIEVIGGDCRRRYALALVDLAERQQPMLRGTARFSTSEIRTRVEGALVRVSWSTSAIILSVLAAAAAVSGFMTAVPVPVDAAGSAAASATALPFEDNVGVFIITDTGEIRLPDGSIVGCSGLPMQIDDGSGNPIDVTIRPETTGDGTVTYSITGRLTPP